MEDTKKDIFRQEYGELQEWQKNAVKKVKAKAQELYDLLEESNLPGTDQRQLAVAKTNLEQAIMWAVKAFTA